MEQQSIIGRHLSLFFHSINQERKEVRSWGEHESQLSIYILSDFKIAEGDPVTFVRYPSDYGLILTMICSLNQSLSALFSTPLQASTTCSIARNSLCNGAPRNKTLPVSRCSS